MDICPPTRPTNAGFQYLVHALNFVDARLHDRGNPASHSGLTRNRPPPGSSCSLTGPYEDDRTSELHVEGVAHEECCDLLEVANYWAHKLCSNPSGTAGGRNIAERQHYTAQPSAIWRPAWRGFTASNHLIEYRDLFGLSAAVVQSLGTLTFSSG